MTKLMDLIKNKLSISSITGFNEEEAGNKVIRTQKWKNGNKVST